MRKNICRMLVSCWCVLCAIAVQAQTDVKAVDFKNFTFEPSCTDLSGETKPEKITVKDGEFMKETKTSDDITERFYFLVDKIAYGDLDGDGQEEAVILTVCNTGGTGNFSEGFVYGLKNGKPALLARIEGGDRAYGGLREARVEKSLLVIESNDVGEEGGACCPEFVITTRYRLNGARLVKAEKETRRELYPTTNVAFDRGASSKQITIKIPAGEMKRFAVGARSGQTLTVTSRMPDVSVTLFKGEAEETEIANGLKARLLKNGDYVFHVSNNAETDRDVSFTVEIK